jgi:serine/threonine-protein kinase
MSEGILQRLEELLAEVLERAPEDRDTYLDTACRDEPELRRELEELLAVHDEAAEYFEDLSIDIGNAAALEIESAAQPRLRIGSYQTLAAIGHGGMGAVYRAERVDGEFDQQVALKLLHRDMDSPQLRARFLAERQLLARLSHPHIARLLDGGVTEEGRPYFAMEHIEGVPITRYCAENQLPVDKILGLFIDVIDAVSYLHRNLVVHRDLKPSNILVDRNGQIKLLDFGIAKMLAEVPEGVDLTRTGEQLMTPEYAAPEQLAGEPVTTATDVYALGVVLYELLTGSRPFDRTSSDPRSLTQDLPPTPSSRLRSRSRKSSKASPGQPDGRSSAKAVVAWRSIAGDLDTICLMALHPRSEARYQSAEQLGQDIERHLFGRPVRARKSTFWYRLGKFTRRHWRGALATAGLLVLIALGFLHERGLRSEAEQARTEAQEEAAKAVAVTGFLSDLLTSVEPAKAQGHEVTVVEVLDQAAATISDRPDLSGQPMVEAAVRRTIGYSYSSLGKKAEAREHLERAFELSGGIAATDQHPVYASDLGVLYLRLGLYEQSEPLLQRVFEVRVEALGEEHPISLRAMSYLAALLWAQGRYEEVERIDRRTLAISRRVHGEEHEETLRSRNGLATTLHTRGRYDEAAQLFEQVLAVKRRQLGDSHPDTLSLTNNLAAADIELGRYAKAESALRQLISARVRVLGEEHGDTVISMHNLGMVLAQLARYEEAAEQLQQVMALRQRNPGQQHLGLQTSCYLADVYREQGRIQEAEALYHSTIQQQREHLGADHADTLKTSGCLAVLRLQQGDLEAAEALINEILEPQLKVRGEEHPDTLESLTTLARIRIRQGRFAEAQELSERAVEAGSRALGPDHPVVLAAVFEQASALAGQQQLQAARELAARVHEVRARMLGDGHPDTVAARKLLESLHDKVS